MRNVDIRKLSIAEISKEITKKQGDPTFIADVKELIKECAE